MLELLFKQNRLGVSRLLTDDQDVSKRISIFNMPDEKKTCSFLKIQPGITTITKSRIEQLRPLNCLRWPSNGQKHDKSPGCRMLTFQKGPSLPGFQSFLAPMTVNAADINLPIQNQRSNANCNKCKNMNRRKRSWHPRRRKNSRHLFDVSDTDEPISETSAAKTDQSSKHDSTKTMASSTPSPNFAQSQEVSSKRNYPTGTPKKTFPDIGIANFDIGKVSICSMNDFALLPYYGRDINIESDSTGMHFPFIVNNVNDVLTYQYSVPPISGDMIRYFADQILKNDHTQQMSRQTIKMNTSEKYIESRPFQFRNMFLGEEWDKQDRYCHEINKYM